MDWYQTIVFYLGVCPLVGLLTALIVIRKEQERIDRESAEAWNRMWKQWMGENPQLDVSQCNSLIHLDLNSVNVEMRHRYSGKRCFDWKKDGRNAGEGRSSGGCIGCSSIVLLCLLFFAGALPLLKAGPLGSRAGSLFDLSDNPAHSLGDMGDGDLEIQQATLWPEYSPILKSFFEGVCALDVELPLGLGKSPGYVVDDFPLLGSTSGYFLQGTEKGDGRSADARAGDRDEGSQNGGVDILEVHEMVLIAFLGWVAGVFFSLILRGISS